MCRSIKPLYNFEPPASDAEIEAAARQFVRKVSGFKRPSQANTLAWEHAVAEVAAACHSLFAALETQAPPKDRAEEAAKARLRAARRGPS